MRPAFLTAVATIAGAAVLATGTTPQTRNVFSDAELDYAEGGAIYRNRCLGCHGPDGVAVDGVDVAARGIAATADDLLGTIINGIPGTTMRPSGLSVFEAGTVIAYLRFVAGDRIGESEGAAARGRALVEGRGECLGCHAIAGVGALIAPDLTGIGGLRRSAELRDSLLDPDAEVRTENRYVEILRKDGTTVTGRLLNQDSFSVQILSMEERLTAISRSDIERLEFTDSPMPSFRDRFTAQELNDVVRYLTTLR